MEDWLAQLFTVAICAALVAIVHFTLGGAWDAIAIIACICGFVFFTDVMERPSRLIRGRVRRREP